MNKNFFALIAAILTVAGSSVSVGQEVVASKSEVVVTKIWDQGKHNAFTDLIRWNDRWYCTFRESANHVPKDHSEDGTCRVIESVDAKEWKSVALFKSEGIDLRDSKISITPDNRMLVVMGGSHYDRGKLLKRTPLVAFVDENGNASEPQLAKIDAKIASETDWLWRVTWHNDVGYGVVYQPTSKPEDWGLQLVSTKDGINYDAVATFDLPGKPNESTVSFVDDRMVIVVRNEDGKQRGHMAISDPPYEDFKWNEIGVRLGGPDLLPLADGRLILGTRKYGGRKQETMLGTLSHYGDFDERVVLPSGGDTSYPGIVAHKDEIWVSYYSSHEGKTSIYLARMPLGLFDAK